MTGIRGLCNGLGPALFGFIFYLFHVNLNEGPANSEEGAQHADDTSGIFGSINKVGYSRGKTVFVSELTYY